MEFVDNSPRWLESAATVLIKIVMRINLKTQFLVVVNCHNAQDIQLTDTASECFTLRWPFSRFQEKDRECASERGNQGGTRSHRFATQPDDEEVM